MSGEGMKALWQELVSWGVVNYGRLLFTAPARSGLGQRRGRTITGSFATLACFGEADRVDVAATIGADLQLLLGLAT